MFAMSNRSVRGSLSIRMNSFVAQACIQRTHFPPTFKR